MFVDKLAKASRRHPRIMLSVGFALGLMLGTGMFLGCWMTLTLQPAVLSSPFPLPETPLHATATDSGSSFAIATGPIDEGVEGIFALDFVTGELQCWVMNTRMNQVGAYYKRNVLQDFGPAAARKDSQYLMVTGQTGFRGGGGPTRPAECAVYVADAKTGQIVLYAIPWNRSAASRGVQGGVLLPKLISPGRNLEIRGQ